MNLQLDIGNSRCKWRLVSDARVIGRGIEFEALRETLTTAGQLKQILLASVRSHERTAEVVASLQSMTDAPIVLARSQARCGGVQNGYEDPVRLGVDRWLALVAAWHERACDTLVVDAGSALTIDCIEASGAHRGGYILPGSSLMADALLQHTDRVRFEAQQAAGDVAPGRTTQTCVAAGAMLACLGAVTAAHRLLTRQWGRPVEIVVSGGYAEALAQLIQQELSEVELRVRPDLVMDGLPLVCEAAGE